MPLQATISGPKAEMPYIASRLQGGRMSRVDVQAFLQVSAPSRLEPAGATVSVNPSPSSRIFPWSCLPAHMERQDVA